MGTRTQILVFLVVLSNRISLVLCAKRRKGKAGIVVEVRKGVVDAMDTIWQVHMFAVGVHRKD